MPNEIVTVNPVVQYYRSSFAPLLSTVTPQGTVHKILPVSRTIFLTGAVFATGLLTLSVATTALLLVGNFFTCFLSQDLRNSLAKYSYEIPLFGTAIPVGLVGALFPQTVNEQVLGIPAGGLEISSLEFLRMVQ